MFLTILLSYSGYPEYWKVCFYNIFNNLILLSAIIEDLIY